MVVLRGGLRPTGRGEGASGGEWMLTVDTDRGQQDQRHHLLLHSGAVDLNVYVPIKSLQACPTPWSLMDCSPSGPSVRGILQARIPGCHFLLQGIFLTQRSNLHLVGLLPWHADYLPLAPSGKPVDPNSLGHI